MKHVIVTLVTCGLQFLMTQKAHACSCAGDPSNLISWTSGYSHILRGTVVKEDKDCSPELNNPYYPCRRYTLRVTKTWKGPHQSIIHVFASGTGSADCGVFLAVGQEHIISAYEREQRLRVSLCSHPMILSDQNVTGKDRYARKEFEERADQLDAFFKQK